MINVGMHGLDPWHPSWDDVALAIESGVLVLVAVDDSAGRKIAAGEKWTSADGRYAVTVDTLPFRERAW